MKHINAERVLVLVVLVTASLLFIGASPVVLLWMLVAEIGLYLAHVNGIESIRDFQALGGKTNGRRTIAVGNLRREVVRGLIGADFLFIGILALLDVRGAVVPGLILGSLGISLNSYLDRRDRIYLTKNGLQARDAEGRFVKE
jgi:hypothetical protein